MGKSQQEKNAHNSYCRQQASNYQSQGDRFEADRAEKQAKLKRLEAAKEKLDAKIQSYESFKEQFNSALSSNLSSASFKGDRRNKFDQTIGKADRALTKDINKHKRNASRLGAEISSYALQVGDLATAAQGAWDMATSFLSQLIT